MRRWKFQFDNDHYDKHHIWRDNDNNKYLICD
jgi:hypothetical protein